MSKISPEKTIESGCLIEKSMAMFATTLDAIRDSDFEDISELATYAPDVAKKLGKKTPWWGKPYEGSLVVSVCLLDTYALRCVLSREGMVNIYGPGGNPDHTFQLPEAGVFGEAATGLGYVNRIRAISDHLYVCGQSRQVYRFDWDGKDLASGHWLDAAGLMRQPPMPEPPDSDEEGTFDRWLDENDAIDLVDIDGPSKDDIYAAGDEVWHWNGQQWTQLMLPTDENINAIKVVRRDEIYLVGHNGTLLKGNAHSGFTNLSTFEDNQNFVGIEWFNGKLYIASNYGLHTYDPAKRKIERHITDLRPDLQDMHVLEAKDGILWSIGFKDLAYFDGKIWTRVDHPDNPPIR